MTKLPVVKNYTKLNLKKIINAYPNLIFLFKENRNNFSAIFPMHNRYFSNGDKPLVALIKKSGFCKLSYGNREFILKNNELIFFDDNEAHSWVMEGCELDIFYYKQSNIINTVKTGNYCLDDFFKNSPT